MIVAVMIVAERIVCIAANCACVSEATLLTPFVVTDHSGIAPCCLWHLHPNCNHLLKLMLCSPGTVLVTCAPVKQHGLCSSCNTGVQGATTTTPKRRRRHPRITASLGLVLQRPLTLWGLWVQWPLPTTLSSFQRSRYLQPPLPSDVFLCVCCLRTDHTSRGTTPRPCFPQLSTFLFYSRT